MREELEQIKKEVKEIQEQSLAMESLKDPKKQNKRLFVIILVILGMWFTTIGYLVYILTDIDTENTEVTQDTNSGNNNFIGNDGDITDGKTENPKTETMEMVDWYIRLVQFGCGAPIWQIYLKWYN